MGESKFYLMAQFDTPAQAQTVLPLFQALNAQGCTAYDWWQAHRDEPDREKFFTKFNDRFPRVADYLGEHTLDQHNGLAGLLDFIDEEDDGWIFTEENRLGASYYTWHCADWSLLVTWLKNHGAQKVVWKSEESMDYFDALRSQLTTL